MLEWLAANAIGLGTAIVVILTYVLVMRNNVTNLTDGQREMAIDLKGIAKSISEHQKDDAEQFEEIRREIAETTERARREAGETIAAMRTKVNEVELFTRDTFMRRNAGEKMQDILQVAMTTLGEKIENRLERMENKIDASK